LLIHLVPLDLSEHLLKRKHLPVHGFNRVLCDEVYYLLIGPKSSHKVESIQDVVLVMVHLDETVLQDLYLGRQEQRLRF
jgi:hypothetical protein